MFCCCCFLKWPFCILNAFRWKYSDYRLLLVNNIQLLFPLTLLSFVACYVNFYTRIQLAIKSKPLLCNKDLTKEQFWPWILAPGWLLVYKLPAPRTVLSHHWTVTTGSLVAGHQFVSFWIVAKCPHSQCKTLQEVSPTQTGICQMSMSLQLKYMK